MASWTSEVTSSLVSLFMGWGDKTPLRRPVGSWPVGALAAPAFSSLTGVTKYRPVIESQMRCGQVEDLGLTYSSILRLMQQTPSPLR